MTPGYQAAAAVQALWAAERQARTPEKRRCLVLTLRLNNGSKSLKVHRPENGPPSVRCCGGIRAIHKVRRTMSVSFHGPALL